MPSQGKKGLIDGSISTSFRDGPDVQIAIGGRSDDQLVIDTSEAVGGTPMATNRITRDCQLHLVRYFIGCWLLLVRSDIVDNGHISIQTAQQTISFAIESGTKGG